MQIENLQAKTIVCVMWQYNMCSVTIRLQAVFQLMKDKTSNVEVLKHICKSSASNT